MIITAKNKIYRCDKDGWHHHRKASRFHRITGPAVIGSTYFRTWYHKGNYSLFQETGPGAIYLDGASDSYHIDGKCCSKEEYEDYCKKQKL